MINKFNLYHALFVALFVLKIGGVEGYDFNWLPVFLPLIVGAIHGYVNRLLTVLGIPQKSEAVVLNMYIDSLRRAETRRAIKDIEKEARRSEKV